MAAKNYKKTKTLLQKYIKNIKAPYFYFIKYYLAKFLNIYPITLRFRNGFKFKIYSITDHFHCQEYINNYYNINNIKNKKIIVDIGANTGDFSIFVSKKSKKIFAFEPVPQLYNKMKENIKLNNVKNVRTFKYAIAENDGVVNFNPETNNFCARVVKKGKMKFSAITWNTLYKIIGKPKEIDLLKIDCEGGEYTLIKQKHILKKIKDIRIELHIFDEKDKINAKKLIAIFKEYKFKPKNTTYDNIIFNLNSAIPFYYIYIHLEKE